MAFYEKKCIVIVTGASVDIGRAFANSFASKMNANSVLVLSSRSSERIDLVKVSALTFIDRTRLIMIYILF